MSDDNFLGDPIFQDLPDEITDDWNHGIIVGGMASSDLLIARAYKAASDMLVHKALESREPYEVAYPIIFMYRHAIELYLKLIVRPQNKNHRLKELVTDLETICWQRYSQHMPAWVTERLLEFAKIDYESFAFRYAKTKSDVFNIEIEYWVELEHLRQVMQVLCDGFERLVQLERAAGQSD